MSNLSFSLYEVFAGATVALVPDADALDAGALQRLATTLTAPTVVFAQRARRDDCDHRLRVFTPKRELPLSAQASFAAAQALAAGDGVAFEEGVTRATLTRVVTPDGHAGFRMPLDRPVLATRAVEDRALVADALGLAETDLAHGLPVTTGSCGVNVLLVPVASPEALAQTALQPKLWARTIEKAKLVAAMPFVPAASGAIATRCLAAPLGVLEDHGAGLGCAALAVWLVHHGVHTAEASARRVFTSGSATVHVEIDGEATRDGAVRLIGHAREIARGTLTR